jgi:hypothetical protein
MASTSRRFSLWPQQLKFLALEFIVIAKIGQTPNHEGRPQSLHALTLAKWETVSGQFGGYLSSLRLALVVR